MFEIARPLGARLASFGLGNIVHRIARLHRQEGEQENQRGQPRVLVSSSESSELICSICMGKIKGELEYCYCDKRSFHKSCLERMHGCPYCKLNYVVKGKENLVVSEPSIPLPTTPVEIDHPVADELLSCPSCGNMIAEADGSCPFCGTIFVESGGTFPCPSCGSQVGDTKGSCPNCGERFDLFVPRTCPECGRPVSPEVKKCACGAVIDDQCPECGHQLADGDTECPQCGTTFEMT